MKKMCLVGIFAGSMFLVGCNTPAIYYEDWYNPPVYWGHHTVREGETLYKIAWRYGRDYRELGNANGLSHPYTIQEGQTIRLDLKGQIPVDSGSVATSSSKPSGARVFVDDPDTQKSVPVENKKENKSPRINVPDVATNLQWEWPHNGEIIRGFSVKGVSIKGVDIKGERGDRVNASAKGHVVYAGSGILGYGNMIILGHDSKTFSVYAHNSELMVDEGEMVEKGQKIAEMGDSGADKVKLYFEMRKNGKAVNPMDYLPKRS